MNRAERRRAKKGKDPVICIKQSDIDRMKAEAVIKASKVGFNLMLLIPAMVIHDKFGMLMKKDHRLDRFVDLCMEQYKCYEESYVELEDLAKTLEEETGVVIKVK